MRRARDPCCPGAGANLEVAMLARLLAFALFVLAAAPAAATFSIVAYDAATGEVGVAVQSKVYGVGQRVAWARGGVGAVATQANSNESFGPEGLRLLAAGLNAEEALKQLLRHDEGRDQRQTQPGWKPTYRWRPLRPAANEFEVAKIDGQTQKLAGADHRITLVHRIGQQQHGTDDAEIPEMDGHEAAPGALAEHPLHQQACSEKALGCEPDGQPEIISPMHRRSAPTPGLVTCA